MDKRIFSGIVFIAILLLIFNGTGFGQAQGGSQPAGAAPDGAPAGGAGGEEAAGGQPGQGMPAGGFVANSPHVGDGATGQAFIDLMDTNKDGKIDHDEWEATKIKTVYKNKRWPEYNKNGDNYITLDEAPQKGVNWEAAPVEVKSTTPNTNQIAFIAKFDKNQDGKVDNTEFTGQHFPVYDANSDGFIEPLEAPAGQTAY